MFLASDELALFFLLRKHGNDANVVKPINIKNNNSFFELLSLLFFRSFIFFASHPLLFEIIT